MTFVSRATLSSAPLVVLLAVAGCGEAPTVSDALVEPPEAALSAPDRGAGVEAIGADVSRDTAVALRGEGPALSGPSLFGDELAKLSPAAPGSAPASEESADREAGWRRTP
jgi:hypothetical protein